MYPGAHPADRPAVTFAPSGTTLTYGALDAAANRVSRLLRAAGLRPGDHIALCVENSPEFYAIVWGAHYAGLIYTACSTSLTAEELSYIVADCAASAFFLSSRVRRPGARGRCGDARPQAAGRRRRPDRRLRGLRRRWSTPTSRRRCPRPGCPGATCSIRRARPGARRASPRPRPRTPSSKTRRRVVDPDPDRDRLRRRTPSTCRPHRCTTRRRCGSRWACTSSAATAS